MTVPTDKFVVLTGGDGVGKSTLLKTVAKLRPDWSVGSLDPEDWLPQSALPHMAWATLRHPRTVIHDLLPMSRATTLLNYISCHYEYWIKPRLVAGDVVIVDSYYYRFYVKEKLKGKMPDFFARALELLPDARLAVIATLSPDICFSRRDEICVHEIYDSPSRDDFVRFQQDVVESLSSLCRERCRQSVNIDANCPGEQLAENFIRVVSDNIGAGNAGAARVS